jgi:SAM-dependent methyltransferase
MSPAKASEAEVEASPDGQLAARAVQEEALAHQECALPRRGLGRALLKRLYYSWAFRGIVYGPLDAVERLIGRRDALTPPRRLQYVGRGDFRVIGARWRDRLVHNHGLGPATDFLDIGCGVGRIAVALTGTIETGSYRGFDIVPEGIRWCRKEITPRFPAFEFELADVRNRQYNPSGAVPAEEYVFPYGAECFDLAVAASVFTHMRPDATRRYLAEAARVLRPGGRLVSEFFLLDAIAVDLLGHGRTAFALDHEFTDPSGVRFLGSDARVPEYNLAIHEEDLRQMAAEVELEVAGIEFGRWSGRAGGPEGRLQDVVTLVKPA